MPSPSDRWLKWIGNILIIASSLFFVETAFEMYLLTVTQGPQMLFFSLVHIAPALFGLVVLSGVAFLCLAVFAFGVQVMKLAGRLKTSGRYSTFMLIILCVQVIHAALLLTYDRWALALFSGGGNITIR
jgi:hypothetical protein